MVLHLVSCIRHVADGGGLVCRGGHSGNGGDWVTFIGDVVCDGVGGIKIGGVGEMVVTVVKIVRGGIVVIC